MGAVLMHVTGTACAALASGAPSIAGCLALHCHCQWAWRCRVAALARTHSTRRAPSLLKLTGRQATGTVAPWHQTEFFLKNATLTLPFVNGRKAPFRVANGRKAPFRVA